MALSESFLATALEVAHRAADEAERAIHARYAARDFSVDAKADETPVTEADREAEWIVKDVLRAAFPGHAFLGEEHGREGQGDYLWLIDPIDGTKAFVRGYPMFSTQIALMHCGELVLGVSAAGEYGERAWAVRGGRHGCARRRPRRGVDGGLRCRAPRRGQTPAAGHWAGCRHSNNRDPPACAGPRTCRSRKVR